MKRALLSISSAVGIVLAVQGSGFAQTPATIEGVVLDAGTDQPLAGVQIGLSTTGVTPVAYNPPGVRIPPTQTTTDAQGRFSLETREAGRFRVVPTRDGYIYSRPGQAPAPAEPGVWIQVAPGERIRNLELRMARPAVISGRVLDATGNPVVGSAGSVTLMRYTYGTDGKRALGWIPGISYPGTAGSFQRMNDQGEFRFYDLPPGEYYLTAGGGGGAIGSVRTYFYPGVTDETKAVPLRVVGGEEIKLGTLTLPPRQKGVEVKLRLSGIGDSETRRAVRFLEPVVELSSLNSVNPGVIGFSVMPGHYDTVVTTDTLPSTNLRYAFVELDAGNSNLDQEVVLRLAPKISVKLLVENAAGERIAAPRSIRCSLRSRFGSPSCLSRQALPGIYELELQDMPSDAYVLSARAGDRNFLAEGLNISGDAEMEVIIAAPGAVVEGTVRAADGNPLGSATVALVPDAPYRRSWVRYRSVVTDPNGKFEIHGIAPGSYKLFAWPELEGAAFRNADFMKEFEERGKPLKIEKGEPQTIELTAF